MARKKLSAILLISISMILMLGYSGFWYILALQVEKNITAALSEASDSGLHIKGNLSEITGFPGKHRIRLSGLVTGNGWQAIIPDMKIRGFFLPGQAVEIELPDGFILQANNIPRDLELVNYSRLILKVPVTLPDSLTLESLRSWQENGEELEVDHYEISNATLLLSGAGKFWLNNDLQPEAQIDVKIFGYIEFIEHLQQLGLIEKRQAKLTGSVLSGISSQDHDTGQRYVNTAINIQNRKLYIGPLQISRLPPIKWSPARSG